MNQTNLRAFVRRHTQLVDVRDAPGVRLHVADDVMTVCRLAGTELGLTDPDLPYWAFAWAGGLAVCRFLAEHPEEVAGRRVIDLASGSGLSAILAMRLGAGSVQAVDIDPFSRAAVSVNARVNSVRISFSGHDLLDAPPPDCDVILAGDVCYSETMARRVTDWLRIAATRGTRVLIGDPGRAYLPRDLERVASYQVQTSRELENAEVKESGVYTFASRH